ncbi:probable Genetic interactor of prohibitins 3,mitochondrial [Zygosaccharomyces bailii ISA1307]|uniref:Genetic interactor of prohibitins 3, mitochondrial n=1 Tax=Zygosaccharomyces bailii (strain CLIB 213 / ATCC 58445 / CBS 680 / BCRC 21525 / NBRC 1098 / NCYC 1416 / NRRL Y-2227) TaxID=1333698 RepID=A0A8J2TAF8_ZYGB2|nr:ZYBA0S10-03422g1_1 [Zygosaccharomyces bailii CLIB 213]CDH17035.1 probable Genetic interactor of prohibitins 3,mitochondrial [Zygosaccharomyces bailii ISA1307]
MFCLQRRWFSTIFAKLVNCNACGIKLQNENPQGIGYYIKSRKPVINKLQSLEDIKYLLFSQDVQRVKEAQEVGSLEELKESMEEPPICKRCNDAVHRNQYDLKEFGRFKIEKVLEQVPKGSNLLHVVPLPEFPFHIEKSLLEGKSYDTSLILTKGDQLAKDKGTLQRKASIFFADFLKYQLGIISNKIVAVSAAKQWNVQSAYALMKATSYLIGDANVGKSTLVNSMMKKYFGYKIHTDRQGNFAAQPPTGEDLKNLKHFFKSHAAGVSHIPNMTRSIQGYRIGDKVVHDLPGFTTNVDEVYLENIIRKTWLERIRKTEKFNTKKLKNWKSITVKGSENGGCYTVGGLFFWQPPNGTINQIVNYLPGEGREFKSLDRGLEVLNACKNEEHPLLKYCAVHPDVCYQEKYARHIIPPFQGSIEVVLKNIGHILLRTTGKYEFKGLHELWVPRGIDVCIREPLERLISKGARQHIESRGKEPACPKDRPIVTSTYVMDSTESEPLLKMREMYLQRTSNDLSSRRFIHDDPQEVVSKLHDENPNLYWYYIW